LTIKFEQMLKPDPEKLMNNILSVIEQKELKIGEVEKSAGLAVGYLARQAKSGRSFPTLETVWRIARTLGVSLEWLLEGNARVTDQANYLNQFVQRLFDQTREGQLDWGRFTVWDVNEMLSHGGREGFPALEESRDGKKWSVQARFPDMDPIEYSMNISPDGLRRIRAVTRQDGVVAIHGSCFWADLSEEERVFLIPYVERMPLPQRQEGAPEIGNVIWYELLLVKRPEGTVLPICSPMMDPQGAVTPGVWKLYEELKAHENEVRVNPGVRSVIDSYMERTAPVQGE